MNMIRKALTIILIGGTVAIAACNTVRGAGKDVQSVANCTEDMMKNGQC
jgi:predicted small secreted protein